MKVKKLYVEDIEEYIFLNMQRIRSRSLNIFFMFLLNRF